MNPDSNILLYQTEDGRTKLEVRLENETVWLTQADLVKLFQSSKPNISEHISHIFEEGELNKDSVVRNFRTTESDGKQYHTNFYNLDVIISVCYRVKSLRGTQFRIWATERYFQMTKSSFSKAWKKPGSNWNRKRKNETMNNPTKIKMHKPLLTLILIAALLSCNTESKKANIMENPEDQLNTTSANDTTPRVTGIGGIFFFSDNPATLKDWYDGKLGIETNEWGSSFEFRNANRPDEINYLQWSPFKTGSEYFSPSKKEFMINYRVQNIEGLVSKLRAGGVTILDSIVTFEYGKFVHILDPEGNKIELWEPVDSVFTAMGGKTTK